MLLVVKNVHERLSNSVRRDPNWCCGLSNAVSKVSNCKSRGSTKNETYLARRIWTTDLRITVMLPTTVLRSTSWAIASGAGLGLLEAERNYVSAYGPCVGVGSYHFLVCKTYLVRSLQMLNSVIYRVLEPITRTTLVYRVNCSCVIKGLLLI